MGQLKRIIRFFFRTNAAFKVKASSLTETIVATVIIIFVFTITITTINSVLERIIKNDTTSIETTLFKLGYSAKYTKVRVPQILDKGKWVVEIKKNKIEDTYFLELKATNKVTKKIVIKKIIINEN